MHELQRFPVKKTFLYALIGSVVFGAFLGIMAILSGRPSRSSSPSFTD